MKIKRYIARDMRHALRQIRDELGPDAVILSSQRTPQGVEVTAAMDHDSAAEAAIAAGLRGEKNGRQREVGTPPAPDSESSASFASRMQQAAAREVNEASGDMKIELKALRQMLETQVASLAWNDLTRRAPVQAELLRELTHLGLSPDLAAELAAQAPRHLEYQEAHRQSLALIARRIPVLGDRYLEQGGMIALVGPTGAGKTTAIAKLAARWVLRHGPRDIALIGADALRIGAQEQIHTLGRLLGVAAYSVDGAAQLAGVLARLTDRRLVLIDTAGLSPKDTRQLDELTSLAEAHPRLENILVLNASAQAAANEQALQRFSSAGPAACILTKLDEATSLGGLLSLLIRTQLPVAYVSDGQHVPEDLDPARAHQLVVLAVELARRLGATADEELLRRRFGGVAHAIA